MKVIPPGWRVLRLPDYRRLWLAHAGSVIGDGFHAIAITWLVFQTLGGGAEALAALGIAYVVPSLVLGILSGTIVDRLDRRVVMVAADVVRAALVALLALLVALGQASVPIVIAVGLGLLLASLFFGPARQALMPSYVPEDELVAANALMQATWQGSQLLTPALGGILFVAIGPVGLLAIDAASFVWSAVLIGRITPGPAIPSPAPHRPLLQEAVDGVRFIAGHGPSRFVVVVGAGNQLFASGPFRVMIPAWVAAVLGGGAPEYGVIMSALAAGLLVGSLVLGSIKAQLPFVNVLVGGVFLDGVFFALFAQAPAMIVAAAWFFALGVTNAILNTAYAAFLQTTVPKDMRGRTFATFSTTLNLTTPLSLAITGAAAAIAGPVLIITASGLGLMAVGAVAFAASFRERTSLAAAA
jgi:MFS family permease